LARTLQEVGQIPRHDTPRVYVDHPVIDCVFQSAKFFRLRQPVLSRRLPHFLREQFNGLNNFFGG